MGGDVVAAAEQGAVLGVGFTAAQPVQEMMDVAPGRGGAAAGELAVLVAQADGAAQSPGMVRVRRPKSRISPRAFMITRASAQSHTSRSAVMRAMGPNPSISQRTAARFAKGWPATTS